MWNDAGYTFEDLIVRFAEAVGLASYVNPDSPTDKTDNQARIPRDRHKLDQCKRGINDGIQEFATANPRGWNCLRPTISLTLSPDGSSPMCVDGDATRYRMPVQVHANPPESWAWSRSGYGSGTVPTVHIDRVLVALRQISGSQSLGAPRLLAVRPFKPDGLTAGGSGGERGWEIVVYPKPDAAYVLEGTARVEPRKLDLLSDRHPFGQTHDGSLLTVAIAGWKRKFGTLEDRVFWLGRDGQGGERKRAIDESLAIDVRNGPRSLGIQPDAEFDGQYVGPTRGNTPAGISYELYGADGTRII